MAHIAHIAVKLNAVCIVNYILYGFIDFFRSGNVRIPEREIEHILGSVLCRHLLPFFKHCPDHRAALYKAFHLT